MSKPTNAPVVEIERPAGPGPVREPAELARGGGEMSHRLGHGQFARFSGIYVWLAFVAIFAVWVPDTFLTTATLKSVAGDQAITVILAVGLLFALAAGQFDLSCAQNVGLSAVVCGALMTRSGMGWGAAVAITLVVGAGIGAINGALILAGVDSFIATLGMSSILLALTTVVSDNQYIGPLPQGFQDVATQEVAGVPIVVIYALVVALVVWYVLEHTPLGRRTYATGANADAARLAGVRTRRFIFGSMVISGLVAAIAGVLVASKIGQVSPTLGPPYLLPAFAAAFLGTTQIKVGRFNVWGTIVAIFLLATGVKGLQLAGGQLWITDLFNGVALVGAVTIAVLGAKRRDARIKAETARA